MFPSNYTSFFLYTKLTPTRKETGSSCSLTKPSSNITNASRKRKSRDLAKLTRQDCSGSHQSSLRPAVPGTGDTSFSGKQIAKNRSRNKARWGRSDTLNRSLFTFYYSSIRGISCTIAALFVFLDHVYTIGWLLGCICASDVQGWREVD